MNSPPRPVSREKLAPAGCAREVLVSVVIVNWNVCAQLERCLKSIFDHHPGMNLRITVVDNASRDGSVEMIRARFPSVRVIVNSRNRGFAAANNQAFAQLNPQTSFILVLNPDVVFTGNALEVLVDFLNSHPEVQVVTPRLLNPRGTLQRGCRRRDPRPLMMLAHLLGLSRLFPKSSLFAGYIYGGVPDNEIHPIEAASGSFLFFRREVLERVGGFDERFFLYAEDLDWCLRVRKNGFSIFYYPEVKVIHQRGASSSRRPLARLWHMHYTALLYILKNRRQDYCFITRWVIYLVLALRLIVLCPLAGLQALVELVSEQKKKSKMPI